MRLSETDEIAAELYLVPPARFVAARDQVVRQAREAGHRDLARELQALRRPALSAWLVNALARHRRDRLQELFALGRELRQAQTQLDAESLRRLPARREELVTELLGWSRSHAAGSGVRATGAALAEVEATLLAGLVDLGAAAAVLSGHLARPMAHAGFGPLPQVETVGGTPSAAAESEPDDWWSWPAGGTGPAWPAEGAAQPAGDELAVRRQRNGGGDHPDPPPLRAAPSIDARENLRRAEAALAGAASAHWQREHDLAEAEATMREVDDRQELLEQQRMQLRREKVAAEQDLTAARAAQRDALLRLGAARKAVEDAERTAQS